MRGGGIGSLYWRLLGKAHQFGTTEYQAEGNRCDSKGNFWSFFVGSRTSITWMFCHLALGTHTPTAHTCSYFWISLFICLFVFLFFRTFYRNGRSKMYQVCSCGNLADSDLEQAWFFTLVELFCWIEEKGPRSKAETQEEKWCNWRALIEELVMEVHSTRVQWPAPLQGPHLLICGSPLPGKYAASEVKERRILLAHCN